MPGNQFTRDYKIVGTTNRIITGNFKSRQLEESGIKGKVLKRLLYFQMQNMKESVKQPEDLI